MMNGSDEGMSGGIDPVDMTGSPRYPGSMTGRRTLRGVHVMAGLTRHPGSMATNSHPF